MIDTNTTPFLPGTLDVLPGTSADYHALARFHYVSGPPATFAAVHVVRYTPFAGSPITLPDVPAPRGRGAKSPAARLRDAEAAAAVADSRVVAVCVLSWPSALHRTRHRVFGLKSMRFGDRLRWANANVRTISRVVVHPQFRGLGLSTRLIRASVSACPTCYVEASARMGRAHPLFDRSGFTRVEPLTADEPLYFWLDRQAEGPGARD